MKNILVERNALYAVGEWAALYDAGLIAQGKIGDDKLGRALDRLFSADRATLQTRIVLAVMNGFDLRMEQIHNDTTSVMVRGAYDGQNAKAVQLKRGHSKEHRPDLKQLVYSLCVTAMARSRCTSRRMTATRPTMASIWRRGTGCAPCCSIRASSTSPTASCAQRRTYARSIAERGFFVTVVPKTRSEVETFTDAVLAGDVRWEEILRKRADRDEKAFDVIECAVGPYHLREGFRLLLVPIEPEEEA